MKLSILIPTYKRNESLKIAVKSILEQNSNIDYEIIISDNDKNNIETKNDIEKWSKNIIYILQQENLGMAGNWNYLIKVANGTHIMFLHDDDYLLPNCFKILKEEIKKNPDKAIRIHYLIYNKINNNIVGRKKIRFFNKYIYNYELYISNIIGPPCGIVIESKIAKKEQFDNKYYPSLDYEWYFRIFKHTEFIRSTYAGWVYVYENNESLKESTLKGFIKMDKKIKKVHNKRKPSLQYLIRLFLSKVSIELQKKYISKNHNIKIHYSTIIAAIENIIIKIIYLFKIILSILYYIYR